ncbi:MAG: glycosyltransferase family 4 protein [Silvibacterium sp.]
MLAGLRPKRTLLHGLLRAALGQQRYPLYLTPPAQRQFARETEDAIRRLKPDAVLAISSHCLIHIQDPGVPVYMMTDAPWLTWKQTYQSFDKMPLLGPRFARLEAAAAQKCTRLIFPSRWAAEEAQRLYGVSPEQTRVHPLGANWFPALDGTSLDAAISARSSDEIRLLFVGKDWERKGGPLALDIARGLKSAGAKVHLDVVGGFQEIPAGLADIVTAHGLLRISDPSEGLKLQQLFLSSHFLVVPTEAECFGLVFAEAQAFGLPPVSRAVHAVPSIIEDGVTGILEPVDAAADFYVRRILALASDRQAYLAMARAARQRFESCLNWDAFARGVVDEMRISLR